MGAVHHQESPQRDSPGLRRSHQPSVVWRCQHFIWCWGCHWLTLGSLEVSPWFYCWSPAVIQHQLGRGSRSRAWAAPHHRSGPVFCHQSLRVQFSGSFRKCWNCSSDHQGMVPQSQDQQNPQAYIPFASTASHSAKDNAHYQPQQYLRCRLLWSHQRVSHWFPFHQHPHFNSATRPSIGQNDIIVAPVLTPPYHSTVAQPSTTPNQPLHLTPSPLCLLAVQRNASSYGRAPTPFLHQ